VLHELELDLLLAHVCLGFLLTQCICC
jgi:hypothetical protein